MDNGPPRGTVEAVGRNHFRNRRKKIKKRKQREEREKEHCDNKS